MKWGDGGGCDRALKGREITAAASPSLNRWKGKAAGRKGKRDMRIPGIIGSKNNGAQSPHTFAGGAEGGLSDGERRAEAVRGIRSRLCKNRLLPFLSGARFF